MDDLLPDVTRQSQAAVLRNYTLDHAFDEMLVGKNGLREGYVDAAFMIAGGSH